MPLTASRQSPERETPANRTQEPAPGPRHFWTPSCSTPARRRPPHGGDRAGARRWPQGTTGLRPTLTQHTASPKKRKTGESEDAHLQNKPKMLQLRLRFRSSQARGQFSVHPCPGAGGARGQEGGGEPRACWRGTAPGRRPVCRAQGALTHQEGTRPEPPGSPGTG